MGSIAGIDEAGRGPVVGPLVIAGVKIKKEDEKRLIELGVKDSKLLTPEQREGMYDKILEIVDSYKAIILTPQDIDAAVNSENTNLNWLEADHGAIIIDELKPDKVYIDCPSTNIIKYTNYLKNKVNVPTEMIVEHKADFNYPVVSAASIIAKVTRDREIEKIKNKIGINIGSGYPSDPYTQNFLKSYWKKYPELFRHSWASYKTVEQSLSQKKIFDFKEVKEEIKRAERLEILTEHGYEFVPVKTEYELARMKGKCVVVLYKSGKILVQGKEQDKKFVKMILKLN